MIELTEILELADGPHDTSNGAALPELALPFDDRQRSRLRTRLSDGREAAILLPRGTVLRDGRILRSAAGERVRVRAAAETVSLVRADDPLLLLRAAYHLGNRHVPLQIGLDSLAYQHDHVLDEMVRGLGLEVTAIRAPFEPEAGAYGGGHGHHHGAHDHGDHLHAHEHRH